MMYRNLKKKNISSILILSTLFITACSHPPYSEDFPWGEKVENIVDDDRDCTLTTSTINISDHKQSEIEFDAASFVRPQEPLSSLHKDKVFIREIYRETYYCHKEVEIISILNGNQWSEFQIEMAFDESIEEPSYQLRDMLTNKYVLEREPEVTDLKYFGNTPFFYPVELTNDLKTLVDGYTSPFQELLYIDIHDDIRKVQLVDLIYFYNSNNMSYHKEIMFNNDFIEIFYELFAGNTKTPSSKKTDYPYVKTEVILDYLNGREEKYLELYTLPRSTFKQLFSEGRYRAEDNFDIYKASAWIPYDISDEELRERLWKALEE